MSADFKPNKNAFKHIDTFEHWCYQVMPLVYDESLSYYEVLCQTTEILNRVIENENKLGNDVRGLHSAYIQLQEYVNNYFNNLDLQREVNAKLDKMSRDGVMYELLYPFFNEFRNATNSLEARMSAFSKLEDGSTTGDAELVDARIAHNGKAWDTLGEHVRDINNRLTVDIEEHLGRVVESVNLFNKLVATEGIWLSPYGGQVEEADGYVVSDYIPFDLDSTYRNTKDNDWFVLGVTFYDKNKNRIALASDVNAYVTVKAAYKEWHFGEAALTTHPPIANARYVRFSFNMSKENVMIVKDAEYPNAYIPYYKRFEYSKAFKEQLECVKDGVDSPLSGKTLIFTGDSICAAQIDNGDGTYGSRYGWCEIIKENNPSITMKNYGAGGTTVGKHSTSSDTILDRLEVMYNEFPDADYIVLQGGVNDCYSSKITLGEISKGYNATLDNTTFCGAMENLLKTALLKWKGKKVCYIVTFKVPTADSGNFEAYMKKAMEICEKWSVPYIDLYHNSGLEYHLSEIATAYSYGGGGLHPNIEGYRVITPKIENWLKTL